MPECIDGADLTIEAQQCLAISALDGIPASRGVDQHLPYRPSRRSIEIDAALRRHIRIAGEAQVCFLNEVAGLQREPVMLMRELAVGELAQLVEDSRHDGIE